MSFESIVALPRCDLSRPIVASVPGVTPSHIDEWLTIFCDAPLFAGALSKLYSACIWTSLSDEYRLESGNRVEYVVCTEICEDKILACLPSGIPSHLPHMILWVVRVDVRDQHIAALVDIIAPCLVCWIYPFPQRMVQMQICLFVATANVGAQYASI